MSRVFVSANSANLDIGDVLDATGAWSVSLWVRKDSGVGGFIQSFISKEGDSGNSGWAVYVFSGTPTFGMFAGAHWTAAGGTLSDDVWQHLLGVYQPSVELRIYLNGTSVGTGTPAEPPIANSNSLRIGRSAMSDAEHFDGRLQEIGIWDAALTAGEAEILADGYSPMLVRRGSLVGYFPLIRDLVELRQNFTITNNSTTVGDHTRMIYPARRRNQMEPFESAPQTGRIGYLRQNTLRPSSYAPGRPR